MNALDDLFFDEFFELLPVPCQSLDSDGRLINVNQKWLDALGYSRMDVIGKWFGDFLASNMVEAFRNKFPQFKNAGNVCVEFEMLRKDGSTIFVVFSGTVIYDKNHDFKQSICIFTEVTASKKMQQMMHDNEIRFKSIYDHSPFGIFQSTIEGKFINVNPALARMLAYDSPNDMIERVNSSNIAEATYADPHMRDVNVKKALNSEDWLRTENRYKCKDGKIVDAMLSFRSFFNNITQREELEGFMEDITERKKSEEELKKRTEELESFNKFAIGRELRMIELKKRIKELEELNQDHNASQ